MWIIALIGGASAFIESTLAQVYKEKDGDSFRGGPAYYIEKAIGKRWLGIIFFVSVDCLLYFLALIHCKHIMLVVPSNIIFQTMN